MILISQYLYDTSHTVKCKCLEIISGLLPIEGAAFKEPAQAILKLISSYMNYQEPRVRSASFKALVNYFNSIAWKVCMVSIILESAARKRLENWPWAVCWRLQCSERRQQNSAAGCNGSNLHLGLLLSRQVRIQLFCKITFNNNCFQNSDARHKWARNPTCWRRFRQAEQLHQRPFPEREGAGSNHSGQFRRQSRQVEVFGANPAQKVNVKHAGTIEILHCVL